MKIKLLALIICYALEAECRRKIFLPRTADIKLEQRPIFVFHGLSDKCSNLTLKKEEMCIETGAEFFDSSDNLVDQADTACEKIKNLVFDDRRNLIPNWKYKFGFHLKGYSQGGLIARLLLHRCTAIRKLIKRILTFSTPHLGINKLPGVWDDLSPIIPTPLLKHNWSFIQYLNSNVYTGTDPNRQSENYSDLIRSMLEGEKVITEEPTRWRKKVKKYRVLRFYESLEAFIVIKNNNDNMVEPNESATFMITFDAKAETGKKFSEFNPKQVPETVGIEELAKSGRFVACAIDGRHLQLTSDQKSEMNRFLQDGYEYKSEERRQELEPELYKRQLFDSLTKNPLRHLQCNYPPPMTHNLI
jgi:hypothetical protein